MRPNVNGVGQVMFRYCMRGGANSVCYMCSMLLVADPSSSVQVQLAQAPNRECDWDEARKNPRQQPSICHVCVETVLCGSGTCGCARAHTPYAYAYAYRRVTQG